MNELLRVLGVLLGWYGVMRNDANGSPPLGLWALALGAMGFACGFFGPIALNPGANQGPLLGIFITVPVHRGRIGSTTSRACCRPIPVWFSTST